MNDKKSELIKLSHDLGAEERDLAILGEGNTSARISNDTFLVKASGSCLANLTESQLTECAFDRVLNLLDEGNLNDDEVDQALLDARVDKDSLKPSVESLFHAYLLSLPDVNFVGHTHPIAVNKILCSDFARDFAEKRLFPDQIVCCGEASVFVPYVDPGLKLAIAIVKAIEDFKEKNGYFANNILMENHGLIVMGRTAHSVLAGTMMAAKSAEIFTGAALLNGFKGPNCLTDDNVKRISGRSDEHYRRKILNI